MKTVVTRSVGGAPGGLGQLDASTPLQGLMGWKESRENSGVLATQFSFILESPAHPTSSDRGP